MIFNLLTYITGTVTIRVKGAMPEKFINLCMMDKKSLLSINNQSGEFIVCMKLSDFLRIRPLVRKSGNPIQVISYSGLPFGIKKMKQRKMLLLGGGVFLFLLNVLLSYIWFVDVIGVRSIPADQIRTFVYESGLKPGNLKEKINTKTIEKEILVSMPEVAWVSISFTGTRAVVEIVEKTMGKEQEKTPAHIIAGKDGVITEVIALTGESAVKKGDTVKKGDILIKGFAYGGKMTDPMASNLPPQFIRANGIIKARVWYESYGESTLEKICYERTGRQEFGVTLRIGQHDILLKKPNLHSEQQFEVKVLNKKLAWWRNRDIAVESNISTYYEVHANIYELTLEEAREEAKQKALAQVQLLIPETAQVLSRTVEILKTSEANLVRVKVNVETAEDIGQFLTIAE